MSPVIKRKGEKFTLPSKYLLLILTILCTLLMLITFGTDVFNRPLNTVVGGGVGGGWGVGSTRNHTTRNKKGKKKKEKRE